jgi:hypothetical protein
LRTGSARPGQATRRRDVRGVGQFLLAEVGQFKMAEDTRTVAPPTAPAPRSRRSEGSVRDGSRSGATGAGPRRAGVASVGPRRCRARRARACSTPSRSARAWRAPRRAPVPRAPGARCGRGSASTRESSRVRGDAHGGRLLCLLGSCKVAALPCAFSSPRARPEALRVRSFGDQAATRARPRVRASIKPVGEPKDGRQSDMSGALFALPARGDSSPRRLYALRSS